MRVLAPLAPELAPGGASTAADASGTSRLAKLVEFHFDFVWRSLRRLGVPEAQADDATQQVWLVVAKRLPDIAPDRERAFLFGTALRVASDARRAVARLREVPGIEESQAVDPRPRADEVVDQKRARALLDDILEELPMSLRAVFVLYELEEMSVSDIASLLSIPRGTVASRLRRARKEFEKVVKRLKARGQIEGELR
jgi:RNA polymerase sigma-70 factor (ECF subfamily)